MNFASLDILKIEIFHFFMLYPKVVFLAVCSEAAGVAGGGCPTSCDAAWPSPAQLNVGLVTRHWANTDLAVITHHIIIDKHWPLFPYTMEAGVTDIALLSLNVLEHLHYYH